MLTLKEAIESYVTKEDPLDRMYGRALAAAGHALQGWCQDEIERGNHPSDILTALTRLAGGMAGMLVMHSAIPSEIERGAALLGEMYAEAIEGICSKLTQTDPEELMELMARAAEQNEEANSDAATGG